MNAKLDIEEQEILDAFEQGKLHPIPDEDLKLSEAVEAARNTLQKTRRVNLRMSERDFHLAHVRAQEEGLPYQTLLASIIHKYLTGRLVEKS
jgi:predicted DNA binding CopG/RHH family protein